MVYERLNSHVEKEMCRNGECHHLKFTFRRNISAEDCLSFIAREAKKAQGKRDEHLLLVTMDIQDAFPTTPHTVILENLESILHIAKTSRLYKYI